MSMNSYLQVQNLTRRVGDKTLFSDLCFSIGEGQKVGLIAKNGTGKSTLLNILGGTDQADEGQVVYRNGLRVGYLEQTPNYPLDLTVIEACFWHGNETTNLIREYETCMASESQEGLQSILDRMEVFKAWDYETRAKTILSQLFITEFDKPLAQLSGGQLKRVALANTLIMEPDLLILDEPTNHLDLQTASVPSSSRWTTRPSTPITATMPTIWSNVPSGSRWRGLRWREPRTSTARSSNGCDACHRLADIKPVTARKRSTSWRNVPTDISRNSR